MIKTQYVVPIFARIFVKPFSRKFATISMVFVLLFVLYKTIIVQYILTESKSIV
jgi:hypothetical protein